MTILDSEKVDLLWKKVLYGVSKTASASQKFASNEVITSPTPVYASQIWAQTTAADIPPTPPGSTTSVVALRTGASAIRMTPDPTSTGGAYLACATFADVSTLEGAFIPTTFGTGYMVKVYVGNPATGPAARLYGDTTGEEYVFDYQSGVLFFPNALPATKVATIGSGSVSIATHGLYIEGYRYVGAFGFTGGSGNGGGSASSYVIADIAARDSLSLNVGDLVLVEDASGIATDAGPGEYAIYMKTGSGFRLLSTADSARSDALTDQVSLTASQTGTLNLGRIGNGARVLEILVEVVTPFDGTFEFTIGDLADDDRLLTPSDIDLQSIGFYGVYPTYRFPTGSETSLILTVTGTATVGQANITFTYA